MISNIRKYFNTIVIILLSLFATLLLSSFVHRVLNPPVIITLDDKIEPNGFEEVIQVSVLNACGEAGLASRTKSYLKAFGFDVVEVGNYDSEMDETFVIARYGDIDAAEKVAYALGVSKEKVIMEIDSTQFVRVTVALGKDFNNLKIIK